MNSADIDRYAGGECDHLAYALNELTGWPYRLVSDEDGEGFGHWVVRVAEDQYLDIRGLHTEAELLAQFPGDVLHRTDPDAWGWLGATTYAARDYEAAIRVLAANNLLTGDHTDRFSVLAEDFD